jgi:hypothetical protein
MITVKISANSPKATALEAADEFASRPDEMK